jgi:hypothetical protein
VLADSYHALSDREWTLEGVSAEGGTVEVREDVPASFWERYDARVGPSELAICTAVAAGDLPGGSAVSFGFQGALAPQAGIDAAVRVEVRRPADDGFDPVGEPVRLSNVPGEPERIEVRAKGETGRAGPVRVTVFATDALLNPVPTYEGTVSLRATGEVSGLPAEARLSAEDEGRAVVEGVEIRDDGPVRVVATDEALGAEATSGPVFAAPVGGVAHHFGGIHFHSRVSHDGDRDLRDAYRYARDWLSLDVAAVTDHTPGAADWTETVAVGDEFDEAGEFVTVPAWEWSATDGHVNLYLRSPDVDAGPAVADPDEWPDFGHFAASDDVPQARSWPSDAIVAPHHTNTRSAARKESGERYWNTYDWSVENDRIELVEVVQGRGCFETDDPDPAWDVRDGGYGASVRDALAAGYRVGFVAGTDNHLGQPTRDGSEPRYAGLTCVLAEERSREAVWTAMDRHRTYATTGVPIVCEFGLEGTGPGGELAVEDGGALEFEAALYGTAPIERVEVISDGECVWADEPDALDVRAAGDLPGPSGEWSYYYLRLRQRDGNMAWLTPVWVDRR